MKIELLDYAIEEDRTTNVWANLSIMADAIGPVMWHIIPREWSEEGRWVTFQYLYAARQKREMTLQASRAQ